MTCRTMAHAWHTREGDHVTLSWRGEDIVEVALEC
jgi:hypothetical protein